MGLLRRPAPGGIVEGGRFSRPYGPGAHSRASEKTRLRLRRHSTFQRDDFPHAASATLGVRGEAYEAVRTAQDPDRALTRFLHTTYEATAERRGWDRAALEDDPTRWDHRR